jgi:hypothetical protein
MNNGDTFGIGTEKLQRTAFAVGAVGAVACVAGALVNRDQFFHSYLVGFLLWTGIAAGSTAVLMIYHLTGGGWGLIVRRLLEAATRMLPFMALLSVPLLLGIPNLYEWSHADAVARDHLLQHKSVYLNVPFFIARTVLYFAIWLTFAYFLNKWSSEQDRTGDPAVARKLEALSAPGLVIYGLAATFASVDWVMSLEPDWFSSAFGMLFMVGQVLSAFSFVIGALLFLADREPLAAVARPSKMNDLGNLLLAFVMLWAYISFSQFLIIWAGNLPEEIIWYRHRLAGGWTWVAMFLVVFHFAVPFLLLLSRHVKRSPRLIGRLALTMLVIRFVDILWMVEPSSGVKSIPIHWIDLAAPAAIGGFWVGLFVRQLRARPLVPVNDPQLLKVELTHG